MIIGTSKEIKDNEYRVGITPGGVRQLVQAGHQVIVETDAGKDSMGAHVMVIDIIIWIVCRLFCQPELFGNKLWRSRKAETSAHNLDLQFNIRTVYHTKGTFFNF